MKDKDPGSLFNHFPSSHGKAMRVDERYELEAGAQKSSLLQFNDQAKN
jgi:hypothetical protein